MISYNHKVQYVAAVSLLIVFAIDISTPAEFVVDILYLCCILIVFKQETFIIISFSVAACLLIVINLLFFDQASKLSLSVWINRGISLFAILITTYISVHYKRLTLLSKQKEKHYLMALEEMLFITSHQVRKPVANILGLAELLDAETEQMSAEELRIRCHYLKSSANELDDVVKALNNFMEQADQRQRFSADTNPNT